MDHRGLLLILLICSGSCAQSSSTHTECVLPDRPRADVLIVLDGFNHISAADFSSVKDSLQSLSSMLGPVAPDLVRVSLVKNGVDPEAEFYLNSFSDQSSVVEAVSRMNQSPAISGGSTRRAVDYILRDILKTERGNRRIVPNVFIFLTDRNSSGVDTDLLNALGSFGVKTFVIRVKLSTEFQVDGAVAEVFSVDDYSRTSEVFADLTQAFCRWIKEKLSRPRPESLSFTEVQSRRARVSWQWNQPGRVQYFSVLVHQYQSDYSEQRLWVLGHRRSTEIFHLLPNTTYSITVRAEDEGGPSEVETGDLTTTPGLVRLSGGPGRCSGSVEVRKTRSDSQSQSGPESQSQSGAESQSQSQSDAESRVWSSVCGSDFGRSEAAVVCAELDCGAVSELHQEEALFSVGPSFHCDGAERSLTECKSSEETRCSSAAKLTCSDAVLMVGGGFTYGASRCRGPPRLRYKSEWRRVSTSAEPDFDFLSLLCEQSGCGSAVSGKQGSDTGPFWWLEPECVKQSSALSDCVDLDLSQNMTKSGLKLLCSGFFPSVRASVSSVSSDVALEKILVMLGTNFTVSCSLDDAFPMEQFHLLSPTGNYTLPPVNQSAHFLFQNASPAHTGNYTCVYCDKFMFEERCIRSNTLVISPGEQSSSSSSVQDGST